MLISHISQFTDEQVKEVKRHENKGPKTNYGNWGHMGNLCGSYIPMVNYCDLLEGNRGQNNMDLEMRHGFWRH
jgi:hypothetical protein